jgi:hypothetical protein
MTNEGATLDDMKPYMKEMAKAYVDHAYDRHRLRPIIYDAARSILKAKRTNDAVAEQFFLAVFNYARGMSPSAAAKTEYHLCYKSILTYVYSRRKNQRNCPRLGAAEPSQMPCGARFSLVVVRDVCWTQEICTLRGVEDIVVT